MFTDVLQNNCSLKVCKFHRKTLVSESSLIKLQALKTPTLLKRDSNTDFFQGNFQDFWEHLVLQTISRDCFCRFKIFSLQLFLKRDSGKDVFSVTFTKFLRTFFDRTLPDDCSLCLSKNFEKFLRTPVL